MIKASNFLDLEWLDHGFGLRDSPVPEVITAFRQIHSSIVLDAGSAEGREGDALVSDRTGVRVGIRTADCVPILLVDPEIRAVAAIHAGWRGSAENIADAAIREMAARWGTRPGKLRAAIGPSIGVCCYEVGPDVARRFGPWIPELGNAESPVHLDLPAINEIQMRAAGVTDIWKSGECTFCTADKFFSYRRERERAGRMLSFIGLQKHFGRATECPPGKPLDV
jgi:YfiH family protein